MRNDSDTTIAIRISMLQIKISPSLMINVILASSSRLNNTTSSMKCPIRKARVSSGCPVVRGPLSKLIIDLDATTHNHDLEQTRLGNAFIFAFAGHDTTGIALLDRSID